MNESLVYAQNNRSHEKGPRTLILDLDETLVHSWEDPSFLDIYEIYSDPLIYRRFHPNGSQQICYSMLLEYTDGEKRIWGLHRPHLHEFLNFAGQYFDNILIWSAGIHPYVKEITKQIFLESGLPPPQMVWSRTNCSKYDHFYHKPIHELVTDLSSRHYQTMDISPESTLILDDKTYTFLENPQNGVLIPPYYPGRDNPEGIPSMVDLLDRSDTALLKFKAWLELPEVRNASDVRLLDKQHIFD